MTVKEYLDWLIPFTENEGGSWDDYDEEYNPNRDKDDLEKMFKLDYFSRYLYYITDKKISEQAYEKAHNHNYFCVNCQPFFYKGKYYLVGMDDGQGIANWIKTVSLETIEEYGGFALITDKDLEEEI